MIVFALGFVAGLFCGMAGFLVFAAEQWSKPAR